MPWLIVQKMRVVSFESRCYICPLTMSDALKVPDENRASGSSLRDKALNNLALAFFAGWSAAMGAHWLAKSRSLGLLYFISTLVFLGIAIRRVYSMFVRG